MRWRPGIETVRLLNLVDEAGTPVVDSEDFQRRLREPHVADLAASIKKLGGKPAHLPIIHRPEKGPAELVGGWDRTAALVINGLKARGLSPDLDGMLEVRAFEGTPEEVAQLRRDENIHRRQDRDRWLREEVEAEARKLAVARSKDSDGADETKGTSAVEPSAATPAPSEVFAHVLGPVPENPFSDLPPSEPPAWGGDIQQAGSPPRPLVSKADKVAARKKVAEKAGTTPAAVKQAEQRDRSKRGETKPARQKHDDSGAALDADQLRTQRVYIDALAAADQAITRIANHIAKQPDAALKVQLAGLRIWRDDCKAARKAAGL